MGLLGDIGGGLGSFVGDWLGQGDRDRAAEDLEKARKGYEGLNGSISVPGEQVVKQGPSNFLSADPSTRAAQMGALAELQNQYRQGGLSAVDRARLSDIQNESNQQARASQAAVMQEAQRRGAGTGGNALVAAQLAGQQGAQRASQQALQVGAAAQQGRMAAIQGAAGIAGGVRDQDYQKATAQDAVDRFNAANSQGVNSRNADRSMQGQQMTFGNGLARQNGIAGVYGAQADLSWKQADATRRRWAALGQGVGSAGDAIWKPGGDGNVVP